MQIKAMRFDVAKHRGQDFDAARKHAHVRINAMCADTASQRVQNLDATRKRTRIRSTLRAPIRQDRAEEENSASEHMRTRIGGIKTTQHDTVCKKLAMSRSTCTCGSEQSNSTEHDDVCKKPTAPRSLGTR